MSTGAASDKPVKFGPYSSPSQWEGRPGSGPGGLGAGFHARPSPRFARPSQREGEAWIGTPFATGFESRIGNGAVIVTGGPVANAGAGGKTLIGGGAIEG